MDQILDQKAGPSQSHPSWTQESSRWRRQIVKATALITALVLGCMAFVRLSYRLESAWFWELAGQGGDEYGSSKGSQYLLGVGKADITG
jgi:neutral ceramidase